MKTQLKIWTGRIVLTSFALGAFAATAQLPTGEPLSAETPVFVNFLVNLACQYPWLATILMIIGALRVVFKPVMLLLDTFVKDNCSPEEYARLQKFESSSLYKWLSLGLDLLGSIKLPVVKSLKK